MFGRRKVYQPAPARTPALTPSTTASESTDDVIVVQALEIRQRRVLPLPDFAALGLSRARKSPPASTPPVVPVLADDDTGSVAFSMSSDKADKASIWSYSKRGTSLRLRARYD